MPACMLACACVCVCTNAWTVHVCLSVDMSKVCVWGGGGGGDMSKYVCVCAV